MEGENKLALETCKWKKIADSLYKQLIEADNYIPYSSLGFHRKTLCSDIDKAIKEYEKNNNNK